MKKTFYWILFSSCMIGCEQAQQAEKEVATEAHTITLTEAQLRQADLQIGYPVYTPLTKQVRAQGTVEAPPQNLISISFPAGGYLSKTDLLPGMPVRKGQVIAVMEDPQFLQWQQAYLQAKVAVQMNRQDLNRQEKLNAQQKLSSDKTVEATRAAYEQALIDMKTWGEKLKMIQVDPEQVQAEKLQRQIPIRSPIHGFVSKVNVNIGKYVSPTDILFELVNPSDIHLTLTVYEADIPALKIGQVIEARLVGNPNRVYHANIFLLGKSLDEQRSIPVHCHFEDAEHDLLPGMYMVSDISVETKNSLTIPKEAVITQGENEYVFIEQKTGVYKLTPVKTGIGALDKLALMDTLTIQSGTRIVTKNAYTLWMKMKNTAEE